MAAAVRTSAVRLVGGGDAVGAGALAAPVAALGWGRGALPGGSRAAVAAATGLGGGIGAWTGLAAGIAGTSASAVRVAGAGTGTDCVSPYPSSTPPAKMMIAQRRIDPPDRGEASRNQGATSSRMARFSSCSTGHVFRKSEIGLAPSGKSVLKGMPSAKPKEGP
jgi:hypothetical protein